MTGAKEVNTHPRMADFRNALKGQGFDQHTIWGYVQGVKRYLEAGYDPTEEDRKRFYSDKKTNGEKVFPAHRTGINKFVRFLTTGTVELDSSRQFVRTKKRRKESCDYDCLNCKYDNCIKYDQDK